VNEPTLEDIMDNLLASKEWGVWAILKTLVEIKEELRGSRGELKIIKTEAQRRRLRQ